MKWVAFGAHLFAEGRVPAGAIFRDENRAPMAQDVPSVRSRSAGFLTEGSASRRIGMGPEGHPFY
jgi:hypothetical protein